MLGYRDSQGYMGIHRDVLADIGMQELIHSRNN